MSKGCWDSRTPNIQKRRENRKKIKGLSQDLNVTGMKRVGENRWRKTYK